MQVARLRGGRVILAGLSRDAVRLECGRKLGADYVVDVERQDLVEVVHELSGGRGADIVYECAGSPTSLAACWRAIRKEGTLEALGVQSGEITTDFNQIMMKELSVIGSYGFVCGHPGNGRCA
jgi:L-iditol 2-dehydrogenase